MIGAYLIGEPGSGKSSLIANVAGEAPELLRKAPVPHGVYLRSGRLVGAQLGLPHRSFPGTDRLSMAIQPKAIAWVHSAPVPAIIGEGDRLSTVGFIEAMTHACQEFTLLWLDTPAALAEERRRARGSTQNEAWIRGRRTKLARLLQAFPQAVRLDGTMPLWRVAEMALEAAPALRAIALPRVQEATGS